VIERPLAAMIAVPPTERRKIGNAGSDVNVLEARIRRRADGSGIRSNAHPVTCSMRRRKSARARFSEARAIARSARGGAASSCSTEEGSDSMTLSAPSSCAASSSTTRAVLAASESCG
jgi:hypothetical protein